MRVKCLAQEHNAVPRPELEPGPFDPESSALTIRPPRLPHCNVELEGIELGMWTNFFRGWTKRPLLTSNVSFLVPDPNPPLDITTENKTIISNEAVSFSKFALGYHFPKNEALTTNIINMKI